MKLVGISDTHFPFSNDLIPEGDVLIHAGDAMYTGLPDEWPGILESLGKIDGYNTKILVPGNHDYQMQNYAGVTSSQLRKAGWVFLTDYRPTATIYGIKYLGIPFVTGLPGWAFNREENWVYDWLNEVTQDFQPDVVISHAPMRGVLDKVPAPNGKLLSVGCAALSLWFYQQENKPRVWFHGHIHESYGAANVEGCEFRNVAMCDRKYKQVNPGQVVEI